ncbi:hypothetical protein NE237_024990 [Protea cynaroides]|uniref:Uncharacterized protein n=1 Tax=Protea cynaroides TaxID=273540 RepID=A0A9Q0H669_9MAGN|nr:hypothetical protein NE237_024990 [Protea cynaroides]
MESYQGGGVCPTGQLFEDAIHHHKLGGGDWPDQDQEVERENQGSKVMAKATRNGARKNLASIGGDDLLQTIAVPLANSYSLLQHLEEADLENSALFAQTDRELSSLHPYPISGDPLFHDMEKKAWEEAQVKGPNPLMVVTSKLKSVKCALKEWNKINFGDLCEVVGVLKANHHAFQRRTSEDPFNPRLANLEKKAKED